MADLPPAPAAAPEARRRVGRAAASILGVVLASLGIFGALVVWHLVRRGRLLRDQLADPRPVRWPDPPPSPGRDEPHGTRP